jgi:hypothetical protein
LSTAQTGTTYRAAIDTAQSTAPNHTTVFDQQQELPHGPVEAVGEQRREEHRHAVGGHRVDGAHEHDHERLAIGDEQLQTEAERLPYLLGIRYERSASRAFLDARDGDDRTDRDERERHPEGLVVVEAEQVEARRGGERTKRR